MQNRKDLVSLVNVNLRTACWYICNEVSIYCRNTHAKINQQLDSSLAHLCLRQFLSSSGIGAGGRCAVGCFPGHCREVIPPWSLPTICQGHCCPRVMTIKLSVNFDKHVPIDVGPKILPCPLETVHLSREESKTLCDGSASSHWVLFPLESPVHKSVCTFTSCTQPNGLLACSS